jgi:hypothetical protein
MAAIVTCQCGAKVRVPDFASDRAFRCPKCKMEISSNVEAKVLHSSSPQAGSTGILCPICLSPVQDAAEAKTCPECGQLHHRECWQEMGGCSTYGCKRAPATTKEGQTAGRASTAWGDTKKCPACGETIKSIALRCRYCDTEFETVDPLVTADLRRRVRKSQKLTTIRIAAIALFVLSLLGLPAPLTLIAGSLVFLPQRKLLAQAGPFFLVLGYGSIVLSAFYSVLLGLFAFHAFTNR